MNILTLVNKHYESNIREGVADINTAAMPLKTWLQTKGGQIFPELYFTSLYLKGLQNCGSAKLEPRKNFVFV